MTSPCSVARRCKSQPIFPTPQGEESSRLSRRHNHVKLDYCNQITSLATPSLVKLSLRSSHLALIQTWSRRAHQTTQMTGTTMVLSRGKSTPGTLSQLAAFLKFPLSAKIPADPLASVISVQEVSSMTKAELSLFLLATRLLTLQASTLSSSPA